MTSASRVGTLPRRAVLGSAPIVGALGLGSPAKSVGCTEEAWEENVPCLECCCPAPLHSTLRLRIQNSGPEAQASTESERESTCHETGSEQAYRSTLGPDSSGSLITKSSPNLCLHRCSPRASFLLSWPSCALGLRPPLPPGDCPLCWCELRVGTHVCMVCTSPTGSGLASFLAFSPSLLTSLRGPTRALHGLIGTCDTRRERDSGQLTWAGLLLGRAGFPHKAPLSFRDLPLLTGSSLGFSASPGDPARSSPTSRPLKCRPGCHCDRLGAAQRMHPSLVSHWRKCVKILVPTHFRPRPQSYLLPLQPSAHEPLGAFSPPTSHTGR